MLLERNWTKRDHTLSLRYAITLQSWRQKGSEPIYHLWQLPVVISYLQKFNKLELFRSCLFRLIKQLEDFAKLSF